MAVQQENVATCLLLPSKRTLAASQPGALFPSQGWSISTGVRESQIPGAGNGRYTLHSVAKDTACIVKPLIPMTSIESLQSVSADRTITFESAEDLEKYVLLSAEEGLSSREQVLHEFENFVYSLDGKKVCLNHSTWTVNHGPRWQEGCILMVERILDDGTVANVGFAIDDIEPGTEILNDYRLDFTIPDWYTQYCTENGFKDVRTNVLLAVDGILPKIGMSDTDSTEASSEAGGAPADVNENESTHLPTGDQGTCVDSEWAEFSVEKWRSAVYTAKSFFSQLFDDTTNFIGDLCDELGGNGDEGPLLVEVGCGTGEALLPLFERAKYTCGMDFNPHFIEFCKQNVQEKHRDCVQHFVGDAQELVNLVQTNLPEEWTKLRGERRPNVVMCVGNTVGIMPPEVRKNVYQQMKEMAGTDGYMVVVYWNGNRFGDAVQNFYHKNPQLCGPFPSSCIDLDTCTLTTPSGYCTHWTKPDEARELFEKEIGVQVTHLVEIGNGVLVAGRMQ